MSSLREEFDKRFANKLDRFSHEDVYYWFSESLKERIEKERKDESCPLEEELGYHGKGCWDECLSKRVHNKALNTILALLTK